MTPRGANAKAQEDGATMLLAPGDLYWAVIEAPPLSRWARLGAPLRRDVDALRFAFEEWAPAPLDEIEIRFASVDDASTLFIACGLERDRLRDRIETLETSRDNERESIESIRPSALPEPVLRRIATYLDDSGEASLPSQIAARLELRTGSLASPARLRRRRDFRIRLVAAVVVASGLLTGSFFLAASRSQLAAGAAQSASAAIATRALTGAGISAGSGGPTLRLTAELRSLERTRGGAAPNGTNSPIRSALKEDRTALYIALIGRWPEEIPVRVESIQVEQSAITLRGQSRTAAEAEAGLMALDGLRSPGGGPAWSIQSRSLGRSGEAATFTAVLTPQAVTASTGAGAEP